MIGMRFSLRHGDTVTDVEVAAPPGTPVHQVQEAVARLGLPAGLPAGTWRVAGRALDADEPWGSPPLLDGVEIVVGGPAPALVTLQVLDGPARGTVRALPAGRHLVGRDPAAALRIEDPDVSRRHVEVDVGERVRVRDVGSTNGTTLLDGALTTAVRGHGADWPATSRLRIGTTTLRWTRCGTVDIGEAGVRGPRHGAVHPDGLGGLVVNPAPHLAAAPRPVSVEVPPEPAPPPPARLSWPAILLPVLFAVPAALLWKQPALLLFGLLSPVLALAQHLVERRSRRRGHAAALLAWEQQRATAEAEVERALELELADREDAHPPPEAVLATAAGPGPALWRHSCPEALVLRIGTADLPAAITVRRDGRVTVPTLAGIPATLDLRSGGVVGLCGPAAPRVAVARALVARAAVRASPRELRVDVRSAAAGPLWAWSAWLPHARSAADTESRAGEALLAVLDGPLAWRDGAGAALLAAATGTSPDGGPVVAVCLADRRDALPRDCAVVVEVAPDGATAMVQRAGEEDVRVAVDGLGPDDAVRLARALAPLRDGTPAAASGASVPEHVRLLDLLDVEPATLAARWREDDGSRLDAVLGTAPGGSWRVDLVRDGPHALIAGTTGSGKSELLTTLVLALAAEHPPERLSLLLVDYKGGTAFGRLADLPHVAGILTDLDGSSATRALASLRAELRRREAALAAAPPDRAVQDVLGRLVVVVDEFRVLAEEHPALLSGLVRVATLGRGLGVHLVLATQRPAGVVSAEIRANTDLRIALRLRDRADSEDVVDAPDAARLPSAVPGRAVVRCAGGPLHTVQTAHLCGAAEPTAASGSGGAVSVRQAVRDSVVASRWAQDVPWSTPAPTATATPSSRQGPDDVDRLVTAIRAAAHLLGSRPQPAPWLPPLPESVAVQELPPVSDPGAIGYALADLPESRSRGALAWNPPRDGHLAVVGPSRSGRSTLLRTLAVGAGAAGAQVHILQGGAVGTSLAGLASLPWVGTVVGADDLERAGRLLEHLASGAGPTDSSLRDDRDGPVLLLVDGWESLEETWSRTDHGRTAEALLRLARDGAGTGLRLAVSGGRALLGGALSGLFGQRVILGADPGLALLAGVPNGRIRTSAPPGRLLQPGPAGDWVEAQVVLTGPDDHRRSGAGGTPRRLVALPGRVDPSEVPLTALGSGGDDAGPLEAGLDETGGALVCGPDGSGRSTALARWAQALAAAGRRVVVVADVEGPCTELHGPGLVVVGAENDVVTAVVRALATLAEHRDHGPHGAYDPHDPVLLLDDGWSRVPGLEDLALRRLVEGVEGVGPRPAGVRARAGLRLVATAPPSEAAVAYRGLLPALRRYRTGLLLGARGPTDGEALGVRLPPAGAAPPGRGVLVVRGRTTPIQVALPRPGAPRPVASVVAGS